MSVTPVPYTPPELLDDARPSHSAVYGTDLAHEREPPRDGGTFDVGDGALVTAADRAAADKRLAQVGLSLREARAVVAEGTSWTVQEW